jgi:hypothetical protein
MFGPNRRMGKPASGAATQIAYFSRYYYGYQIQEDDFSGGCNTHGIIKKLLKSKKKKK